MLIRDQKQQLRKKLLTEFSLLNNDHSNITEILYKEQNLKILKKTTELVLALARQSKITDLILGLYYAIRYEPNILEIKNLLVKHLKVELAFPKIIEINSKEKLIYCKTSDKKPIFNRFNILEPDSSEVIIPDILIIPGLAFSVQGYRLGYGHGFYDKYIKNLEDTNSKKIGVCFHQYLFNDIPKQHFDNKVDYIVTDCMLLEIQ